MLDFSLGPGWYGTMPIPQTPDEIENLLRAPTRIAENADHADETTAAVAALHGFDAQAVRLRTADAARVGRLCAGQVHAASLPRACPADPRDWQLGNWAEPLPL